MKKYDGKKQKNKSRAVANTVSSKRSSGGTFQLVDNRPETAQLQKLQEIIANSQHAKKIAQFQEMMDNRKNPHHVQLRKMQEMLANSPHAKKIAQFQEMADKSTNPYHVQLRKMQEMLANSQLGKTAELPGVVQKKGPLDEEELQLKSKEAVQMAGWVAVNDDNGLEREADVMGTQANNRYPAQRQALAQQIDRTAGNQTLQCLLSAKNTIQKTKKNVICDLEKKSILSP